MTEREALKLALEAFEEIAWSNSTDWQRDRAKVAITAIKEVLAQSEHGTSAVVRDDGNICYQYTTPPQPELVIDKSAAIRIATSLGWEPKRTWQGLTDEEELMIGVATGMEAIAIRMIEAKLKEKNT